MNSTITGIYSLAIAFACSSASAGIIRLGQTPAPTPTPTNSWEAPHVIVTNVAAASRPIWITHAGDGSGRVFFVEQQGKVQIIGNNTAFLDLLPPKNVFPIGRTLTRNLALVSAAFPPSYTNKNFFYLSYFDNDQGGVLKVSRFHVSSDPNVATPSSEELVGTYSSIGCHGGQIVFAADGTLYLNPGGPIANTTLPGAVNNLSVLSGKMLPVLNENTGLLPAATVQTYWPFDRYFGATDCSAIGGAFDNSGGFRMQGIYFYGDSAGTVWGLKPLGTNWAQLNLASPRFAAGPISVPVPVGTTPSPTQMITYPFVITSFGQDEAGRVYVANFGHSFLTDGTPGHPELHVNGGGIYRIDDDSSQFVVNTVAAGRDLTLQWQSVPKVKYCVEYSRDQIHWNTYCRLVGTGRTVSLSHLPNNKRVKFRVTVATR